MPGDFLDLVDRGQVERALVGIEHAVTRSFEADGARMTDAEIRRRFSICEQLFRQLRGDLSWGLIRVIDHLPHYLRCELDGQAWEPDRRTLWIPEDGS
jgi:nitric oxide synthase oxygenase domain/subunit